MIMADLKTNYVDDVLDTTKNQLRKYQQIQNDDGTVSFVDVTEYTQVGTSFGAKDINDTNAAINDVNGKLGELILVNTDISLQGSSLPNINYGIYQIVNGDNKYPGSKFGLLISFNITNFAYKGYLFFDIVQSSLYYCSYNGQNISKNWTKIG